ncbi:hypothetical protein [Luteimonas panaciterrae]|uniref:hypothetical protein n=1 Tax=Luteimonas panaciterrae TaxID=363885 RepID=UPI001CFBD357|nr:hypothetical protein [Luteimonas panaciterrae]
MSETRRMFDALMTDNPAGWPRNELADALSELTSGPSSFGHMKEWSEWLPYLIARITPLVGPWEPCDIYGSLVSAIMVHYPDGEAEYHYPQFRKDLLATVGRALFQSHLWHDNQIIPGGTLITLGRTTNGYQFCPEGSFSAALFFVAKYLDSPSIAGWLSSVVSIEDILWRANWLVWLSGSSSLLLEEGMQPANLGNDWNSPCWWNSWSIKGTIPEDGNHLRLIETPFLGPAKQAALKDAIYATIRALDLVKWRNELSEAGTTHGVNLDFALWQYDEAVRHIVLRYGLD